MTEELTICITSFLRPKSLEACLKSVRWFYPQLKVDVIDTGGNLSAGRNKLVARCTTPYFVLMEDDMEFIDTTNLESLLEIVQTDGQLLGCGGFLQEANYRNPWYHDWWEFRGSLRALPSKQEIRVSPGGNAYRPCQLIQNFGVFRTEAARQFRWDEDLPVGEHQSWFYSFRKEWLVGYCNTVKITHHSIRDKGEYDKHRVRARTFLEVAGKKLGVELDTPIKVIPTPDRPCIVVLGVGHSNTTITTKQIAKLGWNLGDADDRFAESEAVRKINYRIFEHQPILPGEMETALVNLPQPWVIKDPRFNSTLPLWMKAFEKYQPFLVWVQKDMEEVQSSYIKRDQDIPREKLELRYGWCKTHYQNWPWGKLSIHAESIAAAVGLFDLSRTRSY